MPVQNVKIYNGNIITPGGIISNGTLLITGNKIAAISVNDIEAPGAEMIDARGKYIAPGFIDLHVHGGGGHDFMDGTEEAFLQTAKLHAQYGTTALTPTTLSCSKQELINILEVYEKAELKNTHGAKFLGMHLEGPYFAMNQRGAQDARFIRNPCREEYEEILTRFTSIVRWSAAPELPGALEFAGYLCSKNILPALAHTDAVFSEVLQGFTKGYTHATHLYSGMNGVVRRGAQRYAGAVEAAFLMDNMTVEIIADGIHLPAPLLQLVYKIKGPGKTALITDAMRGAGMPPGQSILGSKHNGLNVIIEDGVAKLPDRSAFAGSIATANSLVRNMVTLAGAPLHDAVTMMTATPAAIMRIFNKGTLAPGNDADIILFDDNIDIYLTMIEGKAVYEKQ
jgi:N-acetylglucosamine-6-phosphate deacetylase